MAVSSTCHRSVSATGWYSAAHHLLLCQPKKDPVPAVAFNFNLIDSREHTELKIQ